MALGLNPSLSNWVLDFLIGRPPGYDGRKQHLHTGTPQGCVLIPFLYSLFTHDCVAMHASNLIINFAEDTIVVGLITNHDEISYREEVRVRV